MFNGQLVGTSACAIEETSGKGESTYKLFARNIKNMSTGKDLSIRRMYTDPFDVRNIINFIVCTNMIVDIFPDRRNQILEIPAKYKNDIEYFTLINRCIAICF